MGLNFPLTPFRNRIQRLVNKHIISQNEPQTLRKAFLSLTSQRVVRSETVAAIVFLELLVITRSGHPSLQLQLDQKMFWPKGSVPFSFCLVITKCCEVILFALTKLLKAQIGIMSSLLALRFVFPEQKASFSTWVGFSFLLKRVIVQTDKWSCHPIFSPQERWYLYFSCNNCKNS